MSATAPASGRSRSQRPAPGRPRAPGRRPTGPVRRCRPTVYGWLLPTIDQVGVLRRDARDGGLAPPVAFVVGALEVRVPDGELGRRAGALGQRHEPPVPVGGEPGEGREPLRGVRIAEQHDHGRMTTGRRRRSRGSWSTAGRGGSRRRRSWAGRCAPPRATASARLGRARPAAAEASARGDGVPATRSGIGSSPAAAAELPAGSATSAVAAARRWRGDEPEAEATSSRRRATRRRPARGSGGARSPRSGRGEWGPPASAGSA